MAQSNATLITLGVCDNGLEGPGGGAIAQMLVKHATIIDVVRATLALLACLLAPPCLQLCGPGLFCTMHCPASVVGTQPGARGSYTQAAVAWRATILYCLQDLSENMMGNAPKFVGSAAIGQMLEKGKVKKLNICKNGFISKEMEAIANGVRLTSSLTHLNLSHNLFETEEAGVSLVRAERACVNVCADSDTCVPCKA